MHYFFARKTAMCRIPIFIYLSLLVIIADCSRFFQNGRLRGGNSHVESKLGAATKNFTRWFNQSLDHFEAGNLATWQQRYYVNEQFFDQRKRNVAFLMIGDEGEASDVWMTNGEWIGYANQSNALMFLLEHRFYGKSRPTKDLSMENLRYLTSEQALADIAKFVDSINNEYKLSKKVIWIAFGGSYAGSLAAWVRLKYPHLIHGAVSSSAPLLATPNFPGYYQGVAEDLKTTNEECYSAVKVGTAQIDRLIQNPLGQKYNLTSLFQLCDPFEESEKNKDNVALFYTYLANNFAAIAQFNKDNRLSTKGTLLGNITLDTLCSIMTNTSIGQEIDRLSKVNSLMIKAFNGSCFYFDYPSMIESVKNISWDASDGDRQFRFQKCNEFGLFQSSDQKPHVFGDKFPFEYLLKQCAEVFGSKFDGKYLDYATRRTNTIYGGYDIEVSNVVFVHGSLDPWSALGIRSTKSKNAPVIFINGTAHGANMYNPAEDDLPQLKAARVQIGQFVQSWLRPKSDLC